MAPTTAGTNCLTQAEDAVVELLGNAPEVQSFLSSGDAATAKTRIYLHDIPQPVNRDTWTPAEFDALFPCIIVAGPEDGELISVTSSARDAGLSFDFNAKFSLRFEAKATPGEDDDQEIVRLFLNAAGGAINGIITRIGAGIAGEFQPWRLAVTGGLYRGAYDTYERLGDVLGIKCEMESQIQ